jgi:hypothetical protein
MKTSACFLGLLLAVSVAGRTAAETIVYSTSLSGAAEDTPNGSPGTGLAIFTIDLDVSSLRVEADFSALEGTTTMAHVHCCTAQAGSGTAGVASQVPSYPGFPEGVNSGSYDMTFDMTQSTSFNPAFLAANGGAAETALSALIAGLDAGKAYFNIHSSQFGAGEIRGFFQPVPEPGAPALLATGLAAWLMTGRRRARPAPLRRLGR